MWMYEPSQDTSLLYKPDSGILIERSREKLDRTSSTQVYLLGKVDLSEPSLAQPTHETIVPQLPTHKISHCDGSFPVKTFSTYIL
jgi:hypothetical protein